MLSNKLVRNIVLTVAVVVTPVFAYPGLKGDYGIGFAMSDTRQSPPDGGKQASGPAINGAINGERGTQLANFKQANDADFPTIVWADSPTSLDVVCYLHNKDMWKYKFVDVLSSKGETPQQQVDNVLGDGTFGSSGWIDCEFLVYVGGLSTANSVVQAWTTRAPTNDTLIDPFKEYMGYNYFNIDGTNYWTVVLCRWHASNP